MPRYKIIVNPTSGRGTGMKSIAGIKENLKDVDFELTSTQEPWHASALAKQAAVEGFDVVVAAGGDGTVNEVVNGLMQAKEDGFSTAMGVLPVGRGNDFAFGSRIPGTLEEGCQTLINNHRRIVDVGRVTGGLYPEGRYFGNGVGIGFDAVVGFEALKMKHLHGFASYLVAAMKTIFLYYKAPPVKIIYDGQDLTMNSLMVSIMNGVRAGGGFMMAPEADFEDGSFDICFAEEVSKLEMFKLIPRFMAGTQAGHSAVSTARAKKVSVTALEGILPAHADGETLCTEGTQLDLEILPKSLELVSAPQS